MTVYAVYGLVFPIIFTSVRRDFRVRNVVGVNCSQILPEKYWTTAKMNRMRHVLTGNGPDGVHVA